MITMRRWASIFLTWSQLYQQLQSRQRKILTGTQQLSWHPTTLVWTVSTLSPRTMSTTMSMKMWTKSRTPQFPACSPGEDNVLSHFDLWGTVTSFPNQLFLEHIINFDTEKNVDLDVDENVNKIPHSAVPHLLSWWRRHVESNLTVICETHLQQKLYWLPLPFTCTSYHYQFRFEFVKESVFRLKRPKWCIDRSCYKNIYLIYAMI